jgi:hypothetical protein
MNDQPVKSQTTAKPQLEVERDGWKVTLTFRCADHYDAMKLYDDVCDGARHGFLMLDVETVNHDQ